MLQQRHSKYLEAATSQLGYKLWSQFTTHCCWKEAEGRIIALTSQVLTYHTPPPVHGLSRNECSLSTGGLIVSRCTRSFSRYCMLLECLFWLQSVRVCVCVCRRFLLLLLCCCSCSCSHSGFGSGSGGADGWNVMKLESSIPQSIRVSAS